VFEHEGEVWMIPEAGESRSIPLYRAEQFPYKWKREAVLIDGIDGYDATLLQREGHFWLFVCERVWNSSSWDILSLFHSESLARNWAPHDQNPVLFDAMLSRPAGAFFEHNGRVIRPVQDCSRQYGGAIPLCSLDALDKATFRQTLIGRIHCQPHGCHTYNSTSGFEVIDVFGRARDRNNVTATFAPIA
jgi:hypothetical protein